MDAVLKKNLERAIKVQTDALSEITTVQKAVAAPRGNPANWVPEAADRYLPPSLTGSPRALVGGDGSDVLNLLDMSGPMKVGAVRNRGLQKHWRAMATVFGNQYMQHAAGWSKDLGDPRAFLENDDPALLPRYGKNHGFRNVNKKYGIQKASLAEGSGFTGGYTVPVQFYADLLRLMAEKAFVRDRCTVLPMQSRSLLVPALKQSGTTFSRGQSQFYGGIVMSWTPEANVIAESDPVFREVELVARDLVFVTVASNQLLQDNAVALDTLLTTLFQEACAWSYDYYILQGKLANEPMGVINAPGSYSYARQGNPVNQLDLLTMMSHLYTQSWDNACWIANPALIYTLGTLTNGAAASPFLTWLNPTPNQGTNEGPVAQRIPATLLGLPIFWSEKASQAGTKGDLVLADYSKYLLGDRLAIQIEVSPHVRFTQNQMMWRVIVRWDGTPWQDSPITLADQSFQVSPMVVLT